MPLQLIMALLLFVVAGTSTLYAAETPDKEEEGTVFTLWPLIDYRESPKEGYSNLSVLGPLFKLQHRGKETDTALRPLFYNTSNQSEGVSDTTYLYPIASSYKSPETDTSQILKLYQKNVFRKEEEKPQKGTMLFPFYIKGTSEKYGPYLSVFPFYGELYERFWKDEYHYVMFPIYSRTVKKGTTSRNYFYPFVSIIEGEKERGFQVWPFYGESAKEGVYKKRFAVWPFFFDEQVDLNTDNPTKKFMVLPLYASVESPNRTSHHYIWPFFGHIVDRTKKSEEWDYFWPFFVTSKGENRTLNRYIPFYSEDKRKDSVKYWYGWPLYSEETFITDVFTQERSRILYFLYSDNKETWRADGKDRRKTSFWPLFMYKKDFAGIKSFTFPAPVEPIVDRDGIDKIWAPLWRLYVQKWNNDESAVSFLWNLYWHESRKEALAFEVFPLVSYRGQNQATDLRLLKGLVRYQKHDGRKKLNLFWLPLGINWGQQKSSQDAAGAGSALRAESGQTDLRSIQ